MKNDKLLYSDDYLKLAQSFLKYDDAFTFLEACNNTYVLDNPNFYIYLIKALQKLAAPEWRIVHILVQYNPERDIEEFISPTIKNINFKIEVIKDYVIQFAN